MNAAGNLLLQPVLPRFPAAGWLWRRVWRRLSASAPPPRAMTAAATFQDPLGHVLALPRPARPFFRYGDPGWVYDIISSYRLGYPYWCANHGTGGFRRSFAPARRQASSPLATIRVTGTGAEEYTGGSNTEY